MVTGGPGGSGQSAVFIVAPEVWDLPSPGTDERASEGRHGQGSVANRPAHAARRAGDAGSGLNLRGLREAGLESADLLIATTGLDEVNLVACLLAREIGVRRRIARVHFQDLIEDIAEVELSVLGVDELVNPAEVTVRQLFDMVRRRGP